MIEYIPKSVVLAEIERKKEEEVNYDDDSKSFASYADHIYYLALDSMQDFIDTLEVKETNLDKEIESYFKGFGKFPSVGIADCIDIAKHFFELGLKVQKGE